MSVISASRYRVAKITDGSAGIMNDASNRYSVLWLVVLPALALTTGFLMLRVCRLLAVY